MQNHIVSSFANYNNGNSNINSSNDATYEDDIVKDIRELERRLQEEIEEQKRWSSEEDSSNK